MPIRLNIAALKKDQNSYQYQLDVGRPGQPSPMGRLQGTAKAIDDKGNGDGHVDQAEIIAYHQDPTGVSSFEELSARRAEALQINQQLAYDDMFGTIAEKADGVVKARGKRIGNGDGHLTLGELDKFITEMRRRPGAAYAELADVAQLLRLRFVKP